jgi:hypothetical protein
MTPNAGALTAEQEQRASGHELLLSGDATSGSFPYVAVDASLWRYYEAATASTPVDLSDVEHDPISGVPCAALVAAHSRDTIGFFGRAATFELARDLPKRAVPATGEAIAETLRDRCRADGDRLHALVVGDSAVLSGFETVLLGAGAATSVEFSAEVDLTLDGEQLWRNVRRRYRPFINAGRRDLRIEIVNQDEPDHERFEVYRTLHREVAGRETRPRGSWDVMYELLEEGRGQLVLAYMEERPIAATYFMRFGRHAIYASGAYARDLGKYPVSHWPLYASILEAKRVGVERLILGSVFLEADANSTAKERSIGEFKRGFATEIVARRAYRLEASDPASDQGASGG